MKKKKCRNKEKTQRKIEHKALLATRLGGACSVCGYHTSLAALQFHHRHKSKKNFTISDRRSIGIEKLLKEVKKCDLLCANCHAETHESKEMRSVWNAILNSFL